MEQEFEDPLEKALGMTKLRYIEYNSEYRNILVDFFEKVKADKVYPDDVIESIQEQLNQVYLKYFSHRIRKNRC